MTNANLCLSHDTLRAFSFTFRPDSPRDSVQKFWIANSVPPLTHLSSESLSSFRGNRKHKRIFVPIFGTKAKNITIICVSGKLNYWWVRITIPQNLHSCPMFTKNEQEIKLLGFTADFIYFLGRICNSSVWLELGVYVIVSIKSKQKRRSRLTRRTKTLGTSEDFYVLLSRTGTRIKNSC